MAENPNPQVAAKRSQDEIARMGDALQQRADRLDAAHGVVMQQRNFFLDQLTNESTRANLATKKADELEIQKAKYLEEIDSLRMQLSMSQELVNVHKLRTAAVLRYVELTRRAENGCVEDHSFEGISKWLQDYDTMLAQIAASEIPDDLPVEVGVNAEAQATFSQGEMPVPTLVDAVVPSNGELHFDISVDGNQAVITGSERRARLDKQRDMALNTAILEGKKFYTKGDFDNAITAWKHALQLEPENKELKENIQRAEKFRDNLERLKQGS